MITYIFDKVKFKNKTLSSINSLLSQIIVSRFEIKGDLYMKATGGARFYLASE